MSVLASSSSSDDVAIQVVVIPPATQADGTSAGGRTASRTTVPEGFFKGDANAKDGLHEMKLFWVEQDKIRLEVETRQLRIKNQRLQIKVEQLSQELGSVKSERLPLDPHHTSQSAQVCALMKAIDDLHAENDRLNALYGNSGDIDLQLANLLARLDHSEGTKEQEKATIQHVLSVNQELIGQTKRLEAERREKQEKMHNSCVEIKRFEEVQADNSKLAAELYAVERAKYDLVRQLKDTCGERNYTWTTEKAQHQTKAALKAAQDGNARLRTANNAHLQEIATLKEMHNENSLLRLTNNAQRQGIATLKTSQAVSTTHTDLKQLKDSLAYHLSQIDLSLANVCHFTCEHDSLKNIPKDPFSTKNPVGLAAEGIFADWAKDPEFMTSYREWRRWTVIHHRTHNKFHQGRVDRAIDARRGVKVTYH
ncbi:hypothetical protein K458DRAFT_492647 [Lentithecium fluviatile CBS 122367]|uniref:Uncharacterized protein n=1 Tax=Lentithecium fluviatile CBS 122367 TaxID=1168545 RepID=A0A6G1ID16_9PLEO|nr:hypothetical protein K458DRAFT_492647 [Lentithecium fluviatile CBS 122367]